MKNYLIERLQYLDLIERLQHLSLLQIESLKKNKHALQPFTVEDTINSIIQERNRLILAYNQNPLDEKINAEIFQEIELLQAGLTSTPELEILELRKAIELEIDAKFNSEIGAKILKIESMNVEQLKELLAEIKSQPTNQTILLKNMNRSDDVEVFDSSKEFWQKQEEEINRLIEDNKDLFNLPPLNKFKEYYGK